MPRRHEQGFTLIELLVVIGIFAILTAIIVPIGQRLRENNATSTCEAQLSHIGHALKAYYIDTGGVPPIGVAGTISGGVPTPDANATVDFATWPGLQTLFYLGYLRDRNTLHCPRHTKTQTGSRMNQDSPDYFRSYVLPDPKAKPTGTPLRQYKYMPYRWATASAYPNDYQRQLALTSDVKEPVPGLLVTSWRVSGPPPDDAIVAWCNYHADYYKLNKHGQYVVLYWDASVKLLDKEVFQDTSVAPAEAWQTRATDIAH